MLRIAFLVVAAITYSPETGRKLWGRFSVHLYGIRNRSHGFSVAEHFNFASHSVNDITVCGLKQCSGRKISRKQYEMQLIFKLGTFESKIEHKHKFLVTVFPVLIA